MKEKNTIFHKFLKGKSTNVERSLLMRWWEGFRHPAAQELTDEELAASFARFEARIQQTLGRPKYRFQYVAASVLLVGVLSVGYYFLLRQRGDSSAALAAIAPAQGKAMLILSDGEQLAVGVNLSDTILTDCGVQVLQDEQYGLTIAQSIDQSREEVRYHTVKTPYGGVVRLKLEDGTVVDLNAGTTIRFPNSFSKQSTREIYLDGEAFLAVAKDEKKPFVVRSARQAVQVLGTQFNINTQQPDLTKTTLLEGSVRVLSSIGADQQLILKPGEQAQLDRKGLQKHTVNLDKELDWKNNDFYFENSPIHEVMDKIAHWYDVDVKVNDTKAGVRFTGIISRSRSLKEVLDFLSQTEKMTYTLKERRLYVD